MLSKYGFETTLARSNLMSKIKSNSTKPEIVLRKILWSKGHRYRLNSKKLFGKPDIVFSKYKMVIFVDGEFWHGYNWQNKKKQIKSNRAYWIKKIEKNMAKDVEVNTHYEERGWTIHRFWQKQFLII